MDDQTKIAYPMAKLFSAWAAFGITTWQDAAAFVAFLYSMALLGEWIFKKIWLGWGRDYWIAWRGKGPDGGDA